MPSTLGIVASQYVPATEVFYTLKPDLLLQGEGINATQNNTFQDSSPTPKTITRVGSVTQGSFSPYPITSGNAYDPTVNGGSIYLPDSGNYLYATNTLFNVSPSNSQFTIEGWVLPIVSTTQKTFFAIGNGSAYGNSVFISYANNKFSFGRGNGSTNPVSITSSGTYLPGIWYHIAVTKTNSGVHTLYVNGVANGTQTFTGNLASNASTFVVNGVNDNVGLGNGGSRWYIANLRFNTNSVLYSSDFTPPTAPLQATADTQLLLNGTNGGIIDSTAKNNITTVGNAQISTSVKKYGSSSIRLNGLNGAPGLTIPTTQNFLLSSNNFTIEGWINPSSVSIAFNCILSIGYPVQIYSRNGTIVVYFNDKDSSASYIVNGITGPSSSVSANAWTHFAVVRNGTTFTVYVNGVAGIPATGITAPVYLSTTSVNVGAVNNTYFFDGYIDDLRIVKGTAIYTRAFTPPIQALPNVWA